MFSLKCKKSYLTRFRVFPSYLVWDNLSLVGSYKNSSLDSNSWYALGHEWNELGGKTTKLRASGSSFFVLCYKWVACRPLDHKIEPTLLLWTTKGRLGFEFITLVNWWRNLASKANKEKDAIYMVSTNTIRRWMTHLVMVREEGGHVKYLPRAILDV